MATPALAMGLTFAYDPELMMLIIGFDPMIGGAAMAVIELAFLIDDLLSGPPTTPFKDTNGPAHGNAAWDIAQIRDLPSQSPAVPHKNPPANSGGPMHSWAFYGYYCGPGWTGGLTPGQAGPLAPPTDSLDALCKIHDDCWDLAAKGMTTYQKCDVTLFMSAQRLPANPQKWPKPPPPQLLPYAASYNVRLILAFGAVTQYDAIPSAP